MAHDHFWKSAFWTHVRCVFGHKMAHFQGFWDLRGAKMAQIVLNMGSFYLFVQSVHDPFWKPAFLTYG